MSSQQFSKLNFLSSTQRRFYTRKKPSHQLFNNDHRISKVVKVLNTSCTMRKINKYQFLKTQSNQRFSSELDNFNEPQFIKKQLKSKIQLLLKKSDKKWKSLFQTYEDLKICTSKQTFNIQQNKFFTILTDLLKQNVDQYKNNFLVDKKGTKRQSFQVQKQQKSVKINLQKIKLMKQNQMLRKKCFQSSFKGFPRHDSAFQQITNVPITQQQHAKSPSREDTQSSIKLMQQINQLNQKIYDLQNQNVKQKQIIVMNQDSLRLLRDDKKQLTKKVSQLKNQNENYCSQFVRINLQNENSNIKIDRWRSVISFQRQEIMSYQSQLISIKNQYKDLMRKYKILVKRLNNINSNNQTTSNSNGFSMIKQSQQFTSKYLQTFKQQLETFNKIKMIFYNKQSQNTLDKSNTMTEKKYSHTSTADTYKSFLSQKQTFSNPTAVKKLYRQHYAYFKPNFYNFVETYMDIHGIDNTTMQQLGGGFDLNYQFLTTLRAILDCKFTDFMNQNFSKSSSLANFTYAWLSKYKIQRKQKKIIPIKGDPDKDIIPTFFMNLMSQKLNYNWQIITFRQFLMDTLTLDQLYFYLMARNYIFQGALLQNMSYVYQEISYISIAEVLILLQKFITDVNYRKKIEEYIKRYIVYVRKRPLIDIHFVLRILLEYYQSKKHQQFTNLNSLAQLLSRQKLSSFSFESFLKIFQYNFTYLSLTQKLDIYKKCFSCSRGKINFEVILTVLTQEGYLCKQVNQIFCNDQITVIKDQTKADNQEFKIQPSLLELSNFQQFFQRFGRQSYQQLKSSMGMQHLQKRFEIVKDFSQTNIFQRIQIIFGCCLASLKKMFYSKKISLTVFAPILQQSVQILKKFNKLTCEKKSIMDLMNHFKRETAAKKILRFYRKKRNQMHRNFIFGVKDEAVEEDQKMQNIRKQFNFMIENMNKKFSSKKIYPQE